MQQFDKLLRSIYPNVFGEPIPINGTPGVVTKFKMAEKDNLRLQMFMKSVTNNSLVERDRLLEYSVGSFFNEVNIFILMNEEERKARDSNSDF